ncbi:hypothetical protein QQS21_006129 [Conoideocrella luteorostrata]|uniref:FHA domain-containing protein n=1 Tax=Conoideocrella luteorostrata TaxID=1105319 RepID=A0AAJ0CNC3_9HYPO|nr:hypothetical protein QQS21_006129 [Conoideocrella luteorostrata]
MDELDCDDVILWLLPYKSRGFDGAAFATSMPQNKSRFVAARPDVPNYGARTSVGVVGGCVANADLSFQDIPGISKYHFAITIDDQDRSIARDLGSRGRTKVTYNEEEGERLSNFDWPPEGPSIANGKPPILTLTDLVPARLMETHMSLQRDTAKSKKRKQPDERPSEPQSKRTTRRGGGNAVSGMPHPRRNTRRSTRHTSVKD